MLSNAIKDGGGITGKFFRICGGSGERARRALALIKSFADRDQQSKIQGLKKLPIEYDFDYQIYKMAKLLGQSEEQIKKQYTFTEIVERNLMNTYNSYIERELMKMK